MPNITSGSLECLHFLRPISLKPSRSFVGFLSSNDLVTCFSIEFHPLLHSSICVTRVSGLSSIPSSASRFMRKFIHRGQWKNVCSTSSSLGQYIHSGVFLFPNLCRYFIKHPWPVNNWVRWYDRVPHFLFVQLSTVGISLLVHRADSDSHSACHLACVLSLAVRFVMPVYNNVRSSTRICIGIMFATTSSASAEAVL